jgi:hypothetical protein
LSSSPGPVKKAKPVPVTMEEIVKLLPASFRMPPGFMTLPPTVRLETVALKQNSALQAIVWRVASDATVASLDSGCATITL